MTARMTLGVLWTFTLALALAGCGGGDGNEPPDGNGEVRCGNGACDGDENCTLCAQDCGTCPETCGNWVCGETENCVSCANDCTCAANQMCREGACVARNPLIDAIPGTWDLVEVDGRPPVTPNTVTLSTDTAQPLCGYDPPPVGDACVQGFSPPPILTNTRLYVPENDLGITLEGQVLNGGTRIEYDYSDSSFDPPVIDNNVVWMKRP